MPIKTVKTSNRANKQRIKPANPGRKLRWKARVATQTPKALIILHSWCLPSDLRKSEQSGPYSPLIKHYHLRS